MTHDKMLQMRLRREDAHDALEKALHAVQRELPIGVGQSPIVSRRLDHLSADLRMGSAAYIAIAESLR
jgi:hypothetical protein